MLKRFTVARLVALFGGILLVGCGGDGVVLVAPMPPGEGVQFGVVSQPDGAKVRPAQRDAQLDSDIVWSFDAGPEGAVSRNATTGLTISIPQGALDTPTRITVTALAGSSIAYRFEPHGLQFALPVELSQSLHGMKLNREPLGFARLLGGYFSGDALPTDPVTGIARVVELLPITVDTKARRVKLAIRHFSGYTVASAINDGIGDPP
jgi:hypothetical protein